MSFIRLKKKLFLVATSIGKAINWFFVACQKQFFWWFLMNKIVSQCSMKEVTLNEFNCLYVLQSQLFTSVWMFFLSFNVKQYTLLYRHCYPYYMFVVQLSRNKFVDRSRPLLIQFDARKYNKRAVLTGALWCKASFIRVLASRSVSLQK